MELPFIPNINEQKRDEEKKTRGESGRSKISSPERMRYSNRAMQGKLIVEEKRCPKCHHHKAFCNMSGNSPYFNLTRCTKCGYRHNDSSN